MSRWLSIGFVGALGLSVCSACGGVDDFVGSWKYTSGTQTYVCDGTTTTEAATGNITLSEGSSSDLTLVDADCSIKLDVEGDRATAAGSQTCILPFEGGTGTLTIASFSFSTSDGVAGRLSGNGTITIASGGASATCTYSISGDLEKL